MRWMENLSTDDLQNELVLIMHHVGDIREALNHKEVEYALEGLKDIEESVHRLARGLNSNQVAGMDRAIGQ